jgi:hypothetical protein
VTDVGYYGEADCDNFEIEGNAYNQKPERSDA